jgi:hypothetical protein
MGLRDCAPVRRSVSSERLETVLGPYEVILIEQRTRLSFSPSATTTDCGRSLFLGNHLVTLETEGRAKKVIELITIELNTKSKSKGLRVEVAKNRTPCFSNALITESRLEVEYLADPVGQLEFAGR